MLKIIFYICSLIRQMYNKKRFDMTIAQIKKNMKHGDYNILQKLLKLSTESAARQKFLRGDKDALEGMIKIQENRSIFCDLHADEDCSCHDDLKESINQKADINHTHDWNEITGKPNEFPPIHHSHDVRDIEGLDDVLHTIDDIRNLSNQKLDRDGSNATGSLASTINNNHIHVNKAVLDTITASKVNDWDNAVGKAHNAVTLGSNATGLTIINQVLQFSNGYQLPTTIKVSEWDDAYLKRHTHGNKAVLDNLTQSVIDQSHAHSNKSVIDGITTQMINNWNGSFANSHTHNNKVILDGISSADITNWDTAHANNHTHANKVILDAITAAYTVAEKNKLATIQPNAQVNVKADWNATSGDAEILNKPTSFTPSSHNHAISEVAGLQSELDSKLEANDLDGFVHDVAYNSSLHTLTFYQRNEPNIVIDLPIEHLIKGVQLQGNDLVFTFEDGSNVTIPMNTLLVGVVKSVNGLVANSQGEVVLDITDIPGLQLTLDSKVDQNGGNLTNIANWQSVLGISNIANNYVSTNFLSGRVSNDANTASSKGTDIYYLNSVAANKPIGSTDGALLSMSYSNVWTVQLYGDWRNNRWWGRAQNNGTWLNDVEFWTNGNFSPDTKANTSGYYPNLSVGQADQSTLWNGARYDGSTFATNIGHILGYDGSGNYMPVNFNQAQTWLGIDLINSTLPNKANVDGSNIPVGMYWANLWAGNSDNATKWNGNDYTNTSPSDFSLFMVFDPYQTNTWRPATISQVQAKLGINNAWNLQQVTNNGNTTTNPLVVQGTYYAGGAIFNSGDFAFLTHGGSALRVATGGLLASDDYNDASLIPTNGIYSKSTIATLNHYTSLEWATAYNIAINLQNNIGSYVSRLNINETIDGQKKFIGNYTEWILNDDATNNAHGFAQSHNTGFFAGTLNDKDFTLYRNSIPKFQILNTYNQSLNPLVASNIAVGDLPNLLRMTRQSANMVGFLSDSNGWADIQGKIIYSNGYGDSTIWNAKLGAGSNISLLNNDAGYITSGFLGDYLPLVGGNMQGVIELNRVNFTNTGLSWYADSYTAWIDYMSPVGSGPKNISAPSGELVTTWAKRSFIENSGSYGWTFESGGATDLNPVVVAEIRSSDGFARFGRVSIYGGAASQFLKADGSIDNNTYLTYAALNGYALTSQIPTNNNQLSNGAGYITSNALNGYASQSWVNSQGFLTSASLPNVSNATITYQGTGAITGGGSHTINQSGNSTYNFDLTNQTKNEISLGVNAYNSLPSKQDTLVAGSGISIIGNTISSTNSGGGSGIERIFTDNSQQPGSTASQVPITFTSHEAYGKPEADNKDDEHGNLTMKVETGDVVRWHGSFDSTYTDTPSVGTTYHIDIDGLRRHIYNIIFQNQGSGGTGGTVIFGNGIYEGDQINITVPRGQQINIQASTGIISSFGSEVQTHANLIWSTREQQWILVSYS